VSVTPRPGGWSRGGTLSPKIDLGASDRTEPLGEVSVEDGQVRIESEHGVVVSRDGVPGSTEVGFGVGQLGVLNAVRLECPEVRLHDVEGGLHRLPELLEVVVVASEFLDRLLAVSDCLVDREELRPFDERLEFLAFPGQEVGEVCESVPLRVETVPCPREPVRLTRLEPLELLPEDLPATLVEFTPRQREVLRFAFERGYYEWPREVDAKTLADELGIAKATMLEHLRKAEGKVLNAYGIDDR
jgi:hypothetical protein